MSAAPSTQGAGARRPCAACGAELAPRARYCGRCGAPTRAGARAREQAEERERSDAARLVLGLVVAYGGTLTTILLAALLEGAEVLTLASVAWWNAALVAAGLAGAALVGSGALRASLGRGAGAGWLPLGAAAGLGTVAIGWAWVALVQALVEVPAVEPVPGPAWLAWIAVVVAPPLVEEWLCRGVLWEATRRAGGAWVALAATSVLFALLHGPGGGLLGLPHRLVAGAVFGWLRLRSGSLVPGIAAHAVHNALALALLGG